MRLNGGVIAGAGDAEVAVVEVGGTVGDIESQPFLERFASSSSRLDPARRC